MEITINDVPIEYRLEDETTIGEVYSGIESWLRGNGHRVLDVLIDGASLDPSDRSNSMHPITQVATFSFRVESLRQKDIDDLETIRTYLGLYRRVMHSGNDEQLLAVLEELPYVASGIARLAPDLAGLLEEPLPGPIDSAPQLVTALSAEGREKAASRAVDIDPLLEQRQRELVDPDHEMRSVLALLKGLVDRLEEIPVMLQSGAEKEALTTIGTFSETVSTFLRILPHVTEQHPEIKQHHELLPEINSFLSDIAKALGASDLVLLGDLLEYEMVPRFRGLIEAIESSMGDAQ